MYLFSSLLSRKESFSFLFSQSRKALKPLEKRLSVTVVTPKKHIPSGAVRKSLGVPSDGKVPPWGGSQHRICLDMGSLPRPAKHPFRAEALNPLHTKKRRNDLNKDTTFSIRISSKDLETIKNKAAQARMSQSDYVTRCCLGRQVVVVDGLKEVLTQLKAIGNNLNWLTTLANMGRLQIVRLDDVAQALGDISKTLHEIAARGRWRK